jgi:hypothetical protein
MAEEISRARDCRLLVIDPVSAFMGSADSYNPYEARATLAPWELIARETGVAIVLVQHLRKSGGPAIHQSIGSVSFVAAARSAWLVAKARGDPSTRLFLPMKCNLSPDVAGLSFALEPTAANPDVPAVVWGDAPVTTTADEALAESQRRGGGATDAACEFLLAALADGARPSAELFADAEAAGIKSSACYRAKKRMGILARRSGYGGGGEWVWSLPAGETPDHTPCRDPSRDCAPLAGAIENAGLPLISHHEPAGGGGENPVGDSGGGLEWGENRTGASASQRRSSAQRVTGGTTPDPTPGPGEPDGPDGDGPPVDQLPAQADAAADGDAGAKPSITVADLTPDERAEHEERAAIREHDGGQDRTRAEAEALREVADHRRLFDDGGDDGSRWATEG